MNADGGSGARLGALQPGADLKVYRAGTHRVCSPEETLERWEPLMDTVGVTRLADVTDLDVIGVPVFQAIRPNAKCLSVSQGKGTTPVAAKVSALMEAIEFWHAENHELAMTRATARELRRRASVVDLDRVPQQAGAHITDDARLLWVKSLDLATGEQVWVPEHLVGMDVTLPLDLAATQLSGSSTGLASGNSAVEAVAAGLYEVIERDAYRLAAHDLLHSVERRIDPASIEAAGLDELRRVRAAGAAAALIDITSNIAVPAVACLLCDDPPNPFRALPVALGIGCHPAAEVAASRAITEAAQGRLTVIAGSRDDLTSADYGKKRWSADAAEMRAAVVGGQPRRLLQDLPSWSSDTISGDIERCMGLLLDQGLDQVLVVDLTIDRLGVPVVKVIVPGLEALESSLRPGERARAVLA